MSTLPPPSDTYRRSWATHPRPTPAEDDAYRRSCVNQAVDASRMAGRSPVTAPEVTEEGARLVVSFGIAKTSGLTDEQRRETDGLRSAWTLA